MATVTAQAQSGYRVAVTVTGVPVGQFIRPWTLWRVDAGNISPVRGPAHTESGDVVIDHEAPLNRPLFWFVEWWEWTNAGMTRYRTYSTVAVTVPGALPVLGDPVTGEVTTATVVDWPDWDRGERAATIQVPGSDYPLVVSDRLGAASSTLTLATTTVEQRVALRGLLRRGTVLLLRPSCPGVDDEGSTYLHFTQVQSARRNRNAADVVRLWTLKVTHVAQPTPTIAATGITYGDFRAAYPSATYGQVKAQYATYLAAKGADL